MYRGPDLIFKEYCTDDINIDDGNNTPIRKVIKVSDDPIRSAIIELFMQNKITFDKFAELHRQYMFNIGMPIKKIASNRNNMLKALLLKKTMTYRMFVEITKNILGLHVTGMTFKLRDKENKTYLLEQDHIRF